jgi:hypothetical protein
MRFRPSPATVIATLALFVALGGTSVAAVEIIVPPKSISTAKLADHAVTHSKLAANAVTTANVLNGSLLGADFAPGQIPVGPAGPQGVQGVQGLQGLRGAPGPPAASLWAVVNSDGTLARGSGVVNVSHTAGTGIYDVQFSSTIAQCAWLATISQSRFGFIDTEFVSDTTVGVGTLDPTTAPDDRAFHLAVIC